MAPICASNGSRSEEETSGTSSNSAAAASSSTTPPSSLTAEELFDSGPSFYGMFDRDSDDDDAVESSWAQLRASALSPRAASIPGASETFHKVMRQLDGISEDSAPASSDLKEDKASGGSDTRERKSCPVVKKAASFSASDCKSSSSSSKDSAALAAEAKRRRSVPCMGGGKHVQWADEAGVADLVSVRLIRPRLQAKGEKGEAQAPAPRSILKRLMGLH